MFIPKIFIYLQTEIYFGTMEAQKISKTGRMARTLVGMIEEVTDPELRSQLSYYRNKDNKENVKLINENTTMEATEPKKKISKAMQWARTHVGFIEEITDPELRSQLAYYRKRDNKVQQAQDQPVEAQ